MAKMRAIPAPADSVHSPLAPETLLLEPPPSLPSLTPSVLVDAIAAVMIGTKEDQHQLSFSENRWERTITHRYAGGTETSLTVSGDARYGLLRPAVVRVLLQLLARWTALGCPEELALTIGDVAALTGEDRREIPNYLNAAASLHITGQVRPPGPKANWENVNLNTFSLDQSGSRFSGLVISPRWRTLIESGLQTLLDGDLLCRLKHPLALRL
ncbi:MAG: hypothetical protein H3C62_01340, partial [Gemmatimonadaceae bacterium]|nr:hypothetical protein [Gemmatimonadaceae bacterium]